MATTYTNLSGDLSLWVPDANVTTESMTQAAFLAANPGAEIPKGHNDANGILKVTQTDAAGTREVYSPQLAGNAISSYKNITLRAYIPPAQRDQWAAVSNDARFEIGSGTTGTNPVNGYLSNFLRMNVAGDNVRLMAGSWHCTTVPSQALATSPPTTVLGSLANCISVGTPANLDYLVWGMVGSASGDNIMYIFDVVEIVETAPTLYITFDDGHDEHAQVSNHLRSATKYGGGNFATKLPATFSIIDSTVAAANPSYVSAQDLRNMVAEGSSLAIHGDPAWDLNDTAYMQNEIQDFQDRVVAEGWPKAFAETITFPTNNNYGLTATDGDEIVQVARDAGCKYGRGNGAFGQGLPMTDIPSSADSSLNYGVGVVTLGQNTGTGAAASYVGTTPEAQDVVDFMEASRLSLTLMGHQVVPAAATGIEITESQFDDVFTVFADAVNTGTILTKDLIQAGMAVGLLTLDKPAVPITPNFLHAPSFK